MSEPRILSLCISEGFMTAENYLDLVNLKIQDIDSYYSLVILPGGPRLLSPEGILSRLQAMAEYNITWIVSGPVPWVDDSGKTILRTYLIDDSGKVKGFYEGCHFQDKDSKKLDSGREPFIFKQYGATFALADINELFCPEYFRSMALCGVDAVIVSSCLSDVKKEELDILMKARALENQMYMICSGASDVTIIGPEGNSISPEEVDGDFVFNTIKPGYVKKMRKKFKILESRRPDLYFPVLKL